jgi:cyanate permease
MLASIAGGAAGPWVTGLLHDATRSYTAAFWLAVVASALSAVAIWLAGPRHVRAVAGRVDRLE